MKDSWSMRVLIELCRIEMRKREMMEYASTVLIELCRIEIGIETLQGGRPRRF